VLSRKNSCYSFKVIYDQSEYEIRCEWGEEGARQLAPISDVVIIVDIFSFSTSIEIAVNQEAVVFPYRWKDENAHDFAKTVNAEVADWNNQNGYNLTPTSLQNLPENLRLVLPSPNGGTISLLAENTTIIAGCLRNCRAVAESAMKKGKHIAVIPAGERWENNSLRPCVEDFLGAGAIISYLQGNISPEALLARSAFQTLSRELAKLIKNCISGKETIERYEETDLYLAAELNVSNCVPILKNSAFVKEI
jgi:2-phosphosulfolactate phosphatase